MAAGERKEVIALFRRIEIVAPYTYPLMTDPRVEAYLDSLRKDGVNIPPPDPRIGSWNIDGVTIIGKLSAAAIACRSMTESGLPDPNKPKACLMAGRRTRFFFTERGWRQCGHKVLAEIRSKNLKARVIAIKEKDPRIAITYRDAFQIVAVFSPRRNRRDRQSTSREGGPRAK